MIRIYAAAIPLVDALPGNRRREAARAFVDNSYDDAPYVSIARPFISIMLKKG